jgi:hypothetical protein
MKRMTYFVMALALVLGLAQCKKEQILEPENEAKTVNITLNVGGNGGSRHDINTVTGAVTFQNGDVIYVGDGSTYIGTLTRENNVFSGPINEPADGSEIYFYFVGGLTPSSTPETGTTPSFTVDISDQSSKMPVLSCNHVTFHTGVASYSCVLQNQCALVKFTTASTTAPVHVGGLYTEAMIDFDNNSITNNGTTGFVALNSTSETEKWAVLLPQDDFSNIEGVVADKGYTISMQPGTTISADGFITGEQAIGITSTPSHNRYLQWAVRDLTLEGGDHVYGTLSGNYKISIADGATVTLDGVTINGTDDSSYNWAGITCLGDATIILKDGTTNTVKGFYNFYPGIYVPESKTLTIQGTGTLNASSNGWACGIGGGLSISCGNIEIQGGTIRATGGAHAAGIGSGGGNLSTVRCGTITISGGNVTATGGSSAAGIGSGNGENYNYASCGDITISGGIVEATGGQYAAGIGSGFGSKASCSTITITDGVTSVTATKGNYALDCIGRGKNGTCGTVTIGGTVYSGGADANQPDGLTFVYPILVPTGAINGLFSVSSTKQVYFSQGNLQATTTDNGSTWIWSFATNQYDTIGNAVANTAINGNGTVSTNGTVDLFGWSTAATVNGIHNSESDDYSGDFVDWGNNAIANGGNTANSGWRTLTKDEWVYLFNTRTDAASKKGLGEVNGVNGIILLPDEWTLPSGLTFTPFTPNSSWANVYTTEQWAQMEAGGAVFLPAAGNRQSTRLFLVGDRGYYWSSTANGSTTSYLMVFAKGFVMPQYSAERYLGHCVRLVHDNN